MPSRCIVFPIAFVDAFMNYISRTRKSGLAGQLYTFVHNLSEVARSRNNVVLAVSIPASELEMNAEDQSDFDRFKKLLDRLGRAMIMSAETETSEIVRRRLFEWSSLPKEAIPTIDAYEHRFQSNKSQIPDWFPVEQSRELMKTSYPFHPSVLSVFQRKWQGLPRFQQTRAVLRPPRAVGVGSLRGWLQRRAQGLADLTRHGAAWRSGVSHRRVRAVG